MCNNCGHLPSQHTHDYLEVCTVVGCQCIGLSLPNWSYGEVR